MYIYLYIHTLVVRFRDFRLKLVELDVVVGWLAMEMGCLSNLLLKIQR